MTDKVVKMAVIGCGYWGINYLRLVSQLPQTRLVALCDQSEKRINEIAKNFPEVQAFLKVEDLINQADFDAAIICTTPTSHYEVSSAFLKAGKHILVEKPLTTIATQAKDLVELSVLHDVKLMVGHIFIYNAGVRKVKAFIENGSPGDIYYLYARRTNLGPFREDVNALWDLAPHDIYIFNYFLNSQPNWISAIGAKFLDQPTREDVGFITLGYPNNVLGNIHVSWANPNKEREIVVVGSNQRIVFDDTSLVEKVRVFDKGVAVKEPSTFGEHQLSIRDGDIISPHVPVSEPLKNQVLHFVECIRENKEPLTHGKAGLQVVEVMEAIDASVSQNGAPIKVLHYQ